MSENIQESKMSKYSESAVRQICLKQDIAAVFTIECKDGWIKEEGDEPIDVIAVFDGHGTEFVIDTIRNLDLQEHFTKSDTAESIQQIINKKIENNTNLLYNTSNYKKCIIHRNKKFYERSSGATLSSVYICRNFKTNKIKIQAEWLGDSPIFVFVNGECVFHSEPHNAKNDNELTYLKNKGLSFKVENSETGFEVISENKIMYKPGKYIIFENGHKLAVTRSLGHNNFTPIELQKYLIECTTSDEVKVIVCSDGVFDMLNIDSDIEKLKTYSAEELVELSETRWKQEWIYENEENTRFPVDGYDDCSCAIWWQKNKI